MKQRYIAILLTLVGFLGLGFMLVFTSPVEIGPLGVLVFFTTLFATTFGVTALLLGAFLRIGFGKGRMRKKDYLYAAVFSFAPIMLLMARTFGAISLWTVSLIFVFVSLIEFLVYKRI